MVEIKTREAAKFNGAIERKQRDAMRTRAPRGATLVAGGGKGRGVLADGSPDVLSRHHRLRQTVMGTNARYGRTLMYHEWWADGVGRAENGIKLRS